MGSTHTRLVELLQAAHGAGEDQHEIALSWPKWQKGSSARGTKGRRIVWEKFSWPHCLAKSVKIRTEKNSWPNPGGTKALVRWHQGITLKPKMSGTFKLHKQLKASTRSAVKPGPRVALSPT